MLRCLFAVCCLALLSSCGGDFDIEKITKIESQNTVPGDGSTYFYYGGQVTRPAPPADVLPSDDVELSFVAIFRPGPSAAVPPKLKWHIKGDTDLSLPDIAGGSDLTYVPPSPPPPIAPEIWCIFNSCLSMFTEAQYTAGDFYYAVITVSVGNLAEGSHVFKMCLDEGDEYSPADVPPTVTKCSTVTVNVVASVIASNK